MKQNILLLLALVITFSLNAQFTVVDFEANASGKPDCNSTAEWVGDPNLPVVTVVNNPSVSGINTTANCVKFVETTGSNQGNSLQFAFDGTTDKTGHNFATNKFLSFMIYSENKTSFDILLEIGQGGTPHLSRTKSITTTLNTWTLVEFDFTADAGASTTDNWKTNVRFHFNNGTAGQGDTYYVDEYILNTATVLPVELMDFSGVAKNNAIELNWQTASEENNDRFEIQKSQDGKDFETIGEIAGNGTTFNVSEYNYTDENSINGVNYYRLKQIDFDGKFEYSEIISVTIEHDGKLSIFPTLTSNVLTINYESDAVDVLIYNQVGAEMMRQNVQLNNNTHELSVANLPKGVYFLVVQNGNTRQTVKFIKQ